MADTTEGAVSWAQMSGAPQGDVAPAAKEVSGGISWAEMGGQAPPPTLWERAKTAFAQGDETLGGPKARQGVQQIGQEVKALSNMLVGMPGGVAGVAADIGSRISSLVIGEAPKAAGLRARATAEHTNALWGKVTNALGLTQDASGSNIERLMTQGIEATDVGGEKLEQATGGIVTKETAQSVRDTLLNALGVKGMGMKGVAKGRTIKPGEGVREAVTAEQAIKESKARIAETSKAAAVEEVAAATAKAETVQKVYEDAIKNRAPLEEAWSAKPSKETAAGTSPAWETMVKGLVEPEGTPPIAARMAEKPFDPRFPPEEGVARVRMEEPTIIGEAPDLVDSGIAKLREGKLISTPEAKAIRALKPLPDQGVIVGENGKPYFQRGAVDGTLLKVLGLMGLGAVAGTALYNWYQSSGGLSGDNARDVGLGLAGAGAAGVTRGKIPLLNELHPGRWFKGENVPGEPKYGQRLNNPVRLEDGSRLSGFTDAEQTTFFGYDKNGELFTRRREEVKPSEVRWSKDSSRTAEQIKAGLTEEGKADPKLLSMMAGGTAAALYLINHPAEDQYTNLAAGLLGATVLRKAPTMFDKMSTGQLVEAMKAGGKEAEGAARAIHDETRGKLERSLWSYKDTIDVEGIVQEAYAKTFEAMAKGEFRGDAKPSTFLHTVAQNLAKNAVRDRKAQPDATSTSTVMSPDGEPVDIAETLTSEGMRTPEQNVQNQQMAQRMQEALNALPEQQREMFKAAELDGLSYDEIATQFDVPVGTVRSTISRAREGLQKGLKLYTPEGMRKQSGKVDETFLKVGGAVGGGALIGGMLADDSSKGAVIGAISGLMASALGTKPIEAAMGRGTTRLAHVDPELRRAVRESEMQSSQEISAASDAISAFVKPAKKLSAEAQIKLDTAYSQADPVGVRAALKESPEALAGYDKLRGFLDKTGDRLKGFGRFKEGIPDYLPLLVKDYKGLMDHLGMETRTGLEKYLHNANTKAIKETGNGLSEVEKSLLVNDYLLRDPATSYLPGFAKHRRLKMTPETRPFYHSMDDALIHYAHAAVEDIAEAKFFGKDLRTSKVNGQQYTNLDNSIGALTNRAMEEGRMTPEQAIEVQAVLRARYGKGKMAPSGWAQDVRNVAGAALLGQIGSGLVQTSEGLLSTYHHGIRPAIEAVGIQLTGKGIKPSEFGLANHVIEEVIGKRATGQVLSTLLKVNLLAAFDQMGMGQNLTASFVKNKRLAATPAGQAKLAAKWGADYGPDMPQLIKELQASTTKARTPLVDSLLYQELSDVRPTSRAEAPELYNLHPNARLLYHLKQFMLTQADVLRRDAWDNIKTGEPKKVALGMKNLALYAAALSTVTIPSDAIKNWMMGRGLKLDNIDYVDNFTRNFGLSRYTIDKVARSETPGKDMIEAGIKAVTPPAASVATTVAEGMSNPKKLMPLVPLVGRVVYNRELGGNEAALRTEAIRKRLDLRDAREARNPSLKAARLRKREQAKQKAEAKLRRTQ